MISSIQLISINESNNISDQIENQTENKIVNQEENNLKTNGDDDGEVILDSDFTNSSIDHITHYPNLLKVQGRPDDNFRENYTTNIRVVLSEEYEEHDARTEFQFSCVNGTGIHGSGNNTGSPQIRFGFKTEKGYVQLQLNHFNNSIFIFNDSKDDVNMIDYDNAYTMNISDTMRSNPTDWTDMWSPPKVWDDIVLKFSLKGDLNYIRANRPDLNSAIMNLTFYGYSKTFEDYTTIIHTGISAKLVTWKKEGAIHYYNINSTADYMEMFHFSARNGVMKLKWDFTLENISIHPNLIADYNPSDLKVANCYKMTALSFPGSVYAGGMNYTDPLEFNGTRSGNSDSFFTNTTSMSIQKYNLGNIGIGGNYTWNKTKSEKIVTTLGYKNQSHVFTNWTVAYLTQTFNKFENESIVVDPEANIYFQEEDIHWHDDIEDGYFVYENTYIAQNKASKEFISYSKFYSGLNISESEQTIPWWDNNECEFSVQNATERYFDVEDEYDDWGLPYEMSPKLLVGYQYNETYEELRIIADENLMIPFFLPVWDGVDSDDEWIQLLANSLNETLYYPYYSYEGRINRWNTITYTINPNGDELDTYTIRFENDSGYYFNFEYDLSGELINGALYWEIRSGADMIIINMTLKFINFEDEEDVEKDGNPINGVQWGVDVGDIIYFGENNGNYTDDENYYETCWVITKKETNTTLIKDLDFYNLNIFKSCMLYEGDAYGTFENITIVKYTWNPATKQYDLAKEEPHYGFANELLPFVSDLGGIIIPNNTKKEDLEFCTSQWSLDEGKEKFGGKLVSSFKDENNYYKGDILMANGNFTWNIWYEKSSGLSHLWSLDINDDGSLHWERRYIKENYTLGTINNIELNTQMFNNIEKAFANFSTIIGKSPSIVIGLLPLCPVNETLPSSSGTSLLFIDWLINITSDITRLNITIKLSTSLNLNNLNIRFWVWNTSGNEYDWTTPSDSSDAIIFNYAENSITLIIPIELGEDIKEMIIAFSYTVKPSPSPAAGDDDDDDGVEESAIPSFEVWIVFGIIALVSLIAILKKRNLVKII